MDPFLARVLEETDRLTEGLGPEQIARVLRRSWVDDDRGVHVRMLRAASGPEHSTDGPPAHPNQRPRR